MPLDRTHAFAGGGAWERNIGWLTRLLDPRARQAYEAWQQFSARATTAMGVRLGARAWCANVSNDPTRVVLDRGVICRGGLRIEVFGQGRIHLGENVYVGDDCLLSSAEGIEVGADTLIAHGVQIFDNDSHPVDPESRQRDFQAILSGSPRETIARAPIKIGRNAWIGFNAIILKGVTIGEGSVVGAGSVVVRDVAPFSVVGGNPAKLIRSLASPGN